MPVQIFQIFLHYHLQNFVPFVNVSNLQAMGIMCGGTCVEL